MTDLAELPAIDSALVAALPDGVIALARQLWTRTGHPRPLDDGAGANGTGVDGTGGGGTDAIDRHLERMLSAPLTLEPDWPRPNPPIAVAGGFVHAETLEEDKALLDAMIEANGIGGPEAVAAAAQELRLPVTPYRHSDEAANRTGLADRTALADRTGPADPALAAGATVVDLTTHWAGPLATALLADAGAQVIKIDPNCRQDGFRARPKLYSYLNGSKEIIDLDLRADEDRTRFEALLTSADLIVESFSRRVMPNLGYDHERLAAIAPQLRSLSIRAFQAGSYEQDWIGYGPAIHAASGLAYSNPSTSGSDERLPSPAVVAYPDFLAGLSAYGEALQLLSNRTAARHGEVSLMGSIGPLLLRREADASSHEHPA